MDAPQQEQVDSSSSPHSPQHDETAIHSPMTEKVDSTEPEPEPEPEPESEPKPRAGRDQPGAISTWNAESDSQIYPPSIASDVSGDRVFPIRSVVSVDHATSRASAEEYFPHLSDANSQAPGIPVHLLHSTRADISNDSRRTQTGPLSPTSPSPVDRILQMRRQRGLSGPLSSVQADAARRDSTVAMSLDIASSDKDDDESGVLRSERVADGADHASISAFSETHSQNGVPLVATRFTHILTEDGHSIITGRDGALQQCEDEPIHTPGAVQAFGVMLAMHEEKDGRFVVRYVSENCAEILGYTPKQLFKMKSFLDILTEEQQDNLLDHIDFIRDEDADPALSGPEVFSLSIRPPKERRNTKLWCAIHTNPAHPDLVICEFEKDDDLEYPLRPADESTPDIPCDTLQGNPTLEEIEESTEILSKPLRVLRSARRRRGEQGAMQVFDIMSQVQEQLSAATNLETFLKVLVGIVKELTGFHRVMMYQFDSSFNGKVVTELVDTTKTADLYKGLHFPASDIPRQARDLYKLNKVRLLYDRDLEASRIVCRTQEDLDIPLDMSHSYLRAMSPIHLKYLKNMGVRSSMSISINAFNELWGLVACHSYGNQGMRVSFPIRKMCRLVGDTASRNIERLSYASRLQARKLINTAPTDKNPSGYIIASSDDLLRLFDADFGLLSIKDETKILGVIEHSQEALALLEYLRMRKLTSVVASQDVREDFPDMRYAPGFQAIAGLLYVPLSVGGNDFIVFFRKGQLKEVKWAGNPYEKLVRQGTSGYLEPRSSFKTWNETVIGKCREWVEEQVETAAVLCLVYGKFIEVWRQKEAALQHSNLTRLLLANSAHEVRTPLNAIINYLEIAMEGSLDHETRENLARSHSASKSLIYVINDLLDLTKTEEGQSLTTHEIFELSACIREATDPFKIDAQRKGIEYQVTEHDGLPHRVHGDSRRVRQAISNITANAIAHTTNGYVKVDIAVSEVKDGHATVDFIVADSGSGMSAKQLDSLFEDLEQVSTEESELIMAPERNEKPRDSRTLGLGLAVVARIVRNMDGQLRLKSVEGQGSRFVIQLQFQLPETPPDVNEPNLETQPIMPTNTTVSTPASLASPQGEITLVERTSSLNINQDGARTLADKHSLGSRRSGGSLGSHASQKSDADRLIDAIQTPLSLADQETEYFGLRNSSIKASSVDLPNPAGETISSPNSSKATFLTDPPSAKKASIKPGTAGVRDSNVPIRAIKMPDEFSNMPSHPQQNPDSGVLFEIQSDTSQKTASKSTISGASLGGDPLRILIAEDDPINMKILRKRLERAGHSVLGTVNGEDCATVYREKSPTFDAVLMDMQMPIADGLTSTKMIRSHEKTPQHAGYSPLAARNRGIPIFAVSATLIEAQRDKYIDAGFNGWILKPVDFKRLETLLSGINDNETRQSCLYTPGQWERGGWFGPKHEILADSGEEITPQPDSEHKDISVAFGQQAEGDSELAGDKEPEPSP